MFKTTKTIYAAIFAALAFGASSAAHAESKQCAPIGGMVVGQFYNDGTEVLGAMSGTWAATRGTVVSKKKTATGLLLGMKHAFSTSRNGVVTTQDNVELTTIPGKKDVYAVDIAYSVVESFGHLKGYSGTFYSRGRLNTASGEAVVRYSGQLCK